PSVLPLAGRELEPGLARAVAVDGSVGLAERWASPPGPGSDRLTEALRGGARGDTERLGRLLAPFGVRFLVLTEQAAPARTGAPRRPLPAGLVAAVDQQLDLRRISVSDPAVRVYENTAWLPIRSELDRAATAALPAP